MLTVKWLATRDIEHGDEIFWPYGLTPAEGDEWEQAPSQSQLSGEAEAILKHVNVQHDQIVADSIACEIRSEGEGGDTPNTGQNHHGCSTVY